MCTAICKILHEILMREGLQTRIIIIAQLGPVISGALVAKADAPNAFQVFNAIFNRDDQSKRLSMI